MGHTLGRRLKSGSAENLHSDTCVALGFENVPSQVFATKACTAAPAGILSTKRTTWFKTAQTPTRCFDSALLRVLQGPSSKLLNGKACLVFLSILYGPNACSHEELTGIHAQRIVAGAAHRFLPLH